MGSWFELSHKVTSSNLDTVKVKVDKNKNISLSTFLVSFGFTPKSMTKMFGDNPLLEETLKKDKIVSNKELTHEEMINLAQEDIFKIIRRGDRDTEEA